MEYKTIFRITPGQFEYIVSQTPQGVIGQFLAALLVSFLLLKGGFPEVNLYLWNICVGALLIYRYLNFRRLCRTRDFSANPPSSISPW